MGAGTVALVVLRGHRGKVGCLGALDQMAPASSSNARHDRKMTVSGLDAELVGPRRRFWGR